MRRLTACQASARRHSGRSSAVSGAPSRINPRPSSHQPDTLTTVRNPTVGATAQHTSARWCAICTWTTS
jgi:hypothetical protein